MKKLIVLALVLVMAGSASAALWELDLSTPGVWIPPDGIIILPGFDGIDFDGFDDPVHPGYAEVKAFQDLGGGVWGNALDIGATDHGNGVVSFDGSILGYDVDENVLIYTMRYKLTGTLPGDGGPRVGMSISGSNDESNISLYHKASYWGASEVGMLNNNDDVYFIPIGGPWVPFSNTEPWLDYLTDADWQEVAITIDGPAGAISYAIDGVTVATYTEFRDDFGNGDLVNLAAYPRGDVKFILNGTALISYLSVESIPEPATIALLSVGALALIRKKR